MEGWPSARRRSDGLLRMWNDICNQVCVAGNLEVKSPILVDAGLPQILHAAVFLRSQRWMMQVLLKKRSLLEKSFLHGSRCFGKVPGGTRRVLNIHRPSALRFGAKFVAHFAHGTF